MSKRYEFHSKLSPEEIFIRLRVCAEMAKWDSCDSGTFYYKRTKKGFDLTCTGIYGRWSLPFEAEVKEVCNGSLIVGGVRIWRSAWEIFAQCFVFLLLMTPIFGISISMYPMIILVLLLVVPMSAGLYYLTNAVFYRKQQKAVLDFIQQNLLE